jgi:hypothetical protein
MTFDELWKQATDAAIWVTCSPHEWVWTHDQQVAMARFCCEASKRLSLWKWLTDMRCTVHEAAVAPEEPACWYVADVDNEVLGSGETPELAIEDAKAKLELAAN